MASDTIVYRTLDGQPIRTHNVIRPGGYIFGRGAVVEEYPDAKPKKETCAGCRENFYNGNNPLGIQECWLFKDAVVCDKVGHSSIHREGGPDVLKRRTLRCWSGGR